MLFEQLGSESDALFCWDVRKSNEAGVWNTIQVNECTKVRVDGDENPVFGFRLLQQRSVSGVKVDLRWPQTRRDRCHGAIPPTGGQHSGPREISTVLYRYCGECVPGDNRACVGITGSNVLRLQAWVVLQDRGM